jgi:hypothetical protein
LNEFIWLRTETIAVQWRIQKWIFEFRKLQTISWLAQDPVASQKLLLSITLVCR